MEIHPPYLVARIDENALLLSFDKGTNWNFWHKIEVLFYQENIANGTHIGIRLNIDQIHNESAQIRVACENTKKRPVTLQAAWLKV